MKNIEWKKLPLLVLSLIFLYHISLQGTQLKENSEKKINPRENTDLFLSDGIQISGADEGEYLRMADSGEGILILRGNIKMEYEEKIIFSKKIVYNKKTGDLTLSGDLLFKDKKNQIIAQKFVFNVKDKVGVLYNAKSTEKPILFGCKKLRIINKKTYISKNFRFSTCELERPHYYFLVKKVWIYRDRRVIAYNVIYTVSDIPLFYFPVLVNSKDGTGIISQFGQSKRRGKFIQNTIRYTSENGTKWKYKFDLYQKLGYYGGIEYNFIGKKLNFNLYLAGVKYKPVTEDLENSPLLPEENWFKIILNSNLQFFCRDNANSFANIHFEWMNNWDFERNFDNRYEPQKTLEMIYIIPQNTLDVKNNLNWNFTIGDRGEKHNITLSFIRGWLWNKNALREDVKHYSRKGFYMPSFDQFPYFSLNYNDSFTLLKGDNNYSDIDKKDTITKNDSKKEINRKGFLINWNIFFDANSYKEYLFGEYFRHSNRYSGFNKVYTVFSFFKYFTYTPGIKQGFIATFIEDPNEEYRESSRIEAEKNSFHYLESSQIIKFGLINYYLEVSHFYRRSILEKKVIKPFIHEKLNYLEGGIFLFPTEGIDMSITSRYDAREKFPFGNERLKDISVKNNIFVDFYSYLNQQKSFAKKDKGFFYSGINISNNYTYITSDKKSGYNSLDLSLTTGNFFIPGIDLVKNLEIGFNWFHDFRFSFRDMMSIRWNLNTDISKYWKINMGGDSQADRAHLIYGDTHREILNDLEKTLYFYDEKKSMNAIFTLRNYHLDIIHDLHCWELCISYSINRKIERIGPNNMDRIIFYEQMVSFMLRLKTFPDIGFPKTEAYRTGSDATKSGY